MKIGVYLGSWRLTQLGGMGVYLQNLLRAVHAGQRDCEPRATQSGERDKLVLLLDRSNCECAAELELELEIVALDRPALADISAAERRRVIATRALSYRNVEAADARKNERWTDAARRYLWGLDEAVRAAGIDLLYFTIPPYVKWPRVPVVLTLHDLKHLHRPQDHDLADLARRRRWARVARRADLVYSSFEHVRRDVVERFGVSLSRTAVLPLAPPAELRRRRAIPGESREDAPARTTGSPAGDSFALMPAQFWTHKNHALVFLSVSNLLRNHGVEIPLICTGQTDGECAAHAQQMRQLAEKLGIAHLVRMPGYVSRAELGALYEACRVVIVASLYEAGSFPAMEALALGKPLLASRVTSNPETVGDAGELFDPHDSNDLSAKLLSLWIDPQRRAELAARGPARIPDRTWADVAREWLTLCRSVIKEDTRSRFVAQDGRLPSFAAPAKVRRRVIAAQ